MPWGDCPPYYISCAVASGASLDMVAYRCSSNLLSLRRRCTANSAPVGLTHDELEWELVLYWLFSVSASVVNVLHPACLMGVAGAFKWCPDRVLSGERRVARHTAEKVLPCGKTGESLVEYTRHEP